MKPIQTGLRQKELEAPILNITHFPTTSASENLYAADKLQIRRQPLVFRPQRFDPLCALRGKRSSFKRKAHALCVQRL
jgi:hypothetical protein